MKFLLDENIPVSIKDVIHEEKAIIITLDSDFLQLNKNLQKKSRVIYIKIHPRDPKKIRELLHNSLKKYVSKLNAPCKLIISEDDIILDQLK